MFQLCLRPVIWITNVALQTNEDVCEFGVGFAVVEANKLQSV